MYICNRCGETFGRAEDYCFHNNEECEGNLKRGSCKRCGLDTKINRAEICLHCHKDLNKKDIINKKEIIKPSHYHEGVNVDPIWYGKEHFTHEEMKGFYKMNVIKYVTRADKKNGIEDLIKAKNYLEMLIENVENDDE